MADLPLALFYDTETTGLPLFREPSSDPRQPHIVEIAAILANREGEQARFQSIILPDGWTIPDDIASIHGITTEKAREEGRPADLVMQDFYGLWRMAAFRVAHSQDFDARMVRIALKRHYPAVADEWKAGKAYCTADLSEKICKLPPTQRMIEAGRAGQFKKPKLSEAYRYFFSEEFKDAHRAMPDAEACMRIYRRIWELKQERPAP